MDRKAYIKDWKARNPERVKARRKHWKLDPVKTRARLYRWRNKNREHYRSYLEKWRDRNPFRRCAYDLKYLSRHPGKSMFPIFASLDEFPWMESNIMIDRITPLDELMMKEEGLL